MQRQPTRRDPQLDDDVRAVLAAHAEHRRLHSLTIPIGHWAVGETARAVFEGYLEDDTAQVAEPHITVLDFQIVDAGRWYVAEQGFDRIPELRHQFRDVLHRIAAHISPGFNGEGVANLANPDAGGSRKYQRPTSPLWRPRHFGGGKGVPAVLGSDGEMAVTQPRQDTRTKDQKVRQKREAKTFAVRMKIARDERGWSQEEMGTFLKIREQEVNRAEHAHTWGRPPSERTRRRFAVQLGKRRDWFITEDEPDDRLEELTAEEEASA